MEGRVSKGIARVVREAGEALACPSARFRAAMLFAILAAAKLVIMGGQAAHVVQMHFFVGDRLNAGGATDVTGVVVFLLVLLGALGLLSRDLRTADDRVVRRANIWLTATAIFFLFLSRYEWRRNWLYPVMEGVLDWGDLWGYVTLSLFFKKPYLAAWLGLQAAVWWWLARSRRSAWLPLATGGFAAIYALTCVSYEWFFRGPEFWALSCLGVAGLLCLSREGGGRWRLAAPLAGAAVMWFMAMRPGAAPETGGPYPVMLAGWAVVWFGAAAWMLERAGLGRWLPMMPFAAASFFLLSSHHYPFGENFNRMLTHALLFPRYFADEAMLAIGCWLMSGWLEKRRLRLGGMIADVVVSGLAFVGVADAIVSRKMGTRLDWDVLTLTADPEIALRVAAPYLPVVAVVLLVVWVVRRFRHLVVGPGSGGASAAGRFLAVYFGLAVAVGLLLLNDDKVKGAGAVRLVTSSPWLDSLLKGRMPEEEFAQAAAELGYFQEPQRLGLDPDGRAGMNVLLVIMESSYSKHLSLFGAKDETQPRLAGYRDRMELFPNYFMNFPTSNHARTTILTGLHSPRRAIPQLAPKIPVASLFEVLHGAGYTTSVYDSCFTEYARFRDFLNTRAIDTLRDYHNMPGREDYERLQWGLPEECTMKAMLDQIDAYAEGTKPFFLTYMPVAPHYPFDTRPDQFAVFEGPSPIFTGDYSHRYKNELLYMDWVISSVIDRLRERGLLDRTVVVITNDHGERLGEVDGRLGHGWELNPELANQPLIVMDPKRPGARVNREPGSHVDLLLTVLDLVGIPPPEEELYQGRSLYRALGWAKRIHLGSYDHRAIIVDGRYLLEKPRGNSRPSLIESYRIDGSGPRARFERAPQEPQGYPVTEQMDLFERFQDSLIGGYRQYREVMGARARP